MSRPWASSKSRGARKVFVADLRAYLAQAAARPFRYGRHDCFTVAARWIAACGGCDVLTGREYASLREGLSLAAQDGHSDHLPWLHEACERIAPLTARAGDLAVFLQDDLPAVGIVRPGGEDVLSVSRTGPGIAPLTRADYCLRVLR